MKPILYTAPFAILAIFIGQSLDSDTAALAMGAIIGIMGAALAALITALVRDERRNRQREEARRPHSASSSEAPSYYIDGDWHELPTPHVAAPPTVVIASRSGEAISPPAPSRALTIRR